MERFQAVYLVALVVTPIILWWLPSDFFDNGKIILCFSRRWFGVECLGCGMTRAVMHFHHFNFQKAMFFNKGVVFIYPLLGWIWVQLLKKLLKSLDSK